VHLEGNSIDPAKAGAQPKQFIMSGEEFDYESLFALGCIRMITLDPSDPDNAGLIQRARACGITVAAGHTAATYEQMVEAVKAGVTVSTHTFNQMEGIHHRKPGTAGAALLLPELFAQFIPDGQHLHPAICNMICLLKGPRRAVLITDSIRATGMPDGEYELGGQPVVLKDGKVVLKDDPNTIAGSVLTMDRGVANLRDFTGLPLAQCIQMASLTPAQALGFTNCGVIAPGMRADLAVLNPDLAVQETIVGGETVYQREAV